MGVSLSSYNLFDRYQIPGKLEHTRILPVTFSSLMCLALPRAQVVMGISEPYPLGRFSPSVRPAATAARLLDSFQTCLVRWQRNQCAFSKIM